MQYFFFCRNKSGVTALQEASRQGLNDLIIELFKHGADISTRDSDGNSALHVKYSCLLIRTNRACFCLFNVVVAFGMLKFFLFLFYLCIYPPDSR